MDRPLDALPEGTKLAGYVIGRVLGRGTFGVTYLATDDLFSDKKFAIKEFLPAGIAVRKAGELTVHPTSPDRVESFKRALASFRREALVLRELRHPNVVDVQRYIEHNGTAYVVMKYEEGDSLAEALKSGPLAESEVMELLPPLLDGLEAVHAKKFVHRDLKPANIYLRADGSPVLLDFGAAREAIGEERKTSLSEVLTPGYAPLEQYDRHAEQGPYTDIYALGATLYRCMTGRPPDEAITRHNALRRGEPDPLVPIERAAPGRYSAPLADAVRRALEVDENKRPQTIAELRALLPIQPSRRAVPTADAPTLTPGSPARRTSRKRWALAASLVVAAGAAALVAYQAWVPHGGAEMAEQRRKSEVAGRREEVPRPPGARVFRDCPQCPEMIVIPAGTFTMGSPPDEEQRTDDEGPQHPATIAKPFALGKYEVTFADWDACVAAGGCAHQPNDRGWGRGRRPVIDVSWGDAKAYVAWLSRTAGKAYRLPSEAEWEYAARAGTTTPFSTGETISTDEANYNGNYVYGPGRKGVYRQQTVPVGMFAPNPFGLHDMHGNVWEWVEDCWNETYDGAPRDGRSWLTADCSRRVLRGGSWSFGTRHLRSAAREGYSASTRFDSRGFRVARTLD